jgi:hypothetical protein
MPRNRELETQLREVARDFDRAFPARPQLSRMIMRQVEREPQRGRRIGRRLVGELALTGLLLVGGAALAIAIAQAHSLPAARSQPAASVKPSATPPPRASLPEKDLAGAGLSKVAALITPEDLQVQSGGHTVSLIGAYADPSRIVLFFRADQVTMDMLTSSYDVLIDDGRGFVNTTGGGYSGVAGDLVTYLDGRPHVAADGLAHLNITMFGWRPVPNPQSPPPRLQWKFVIALPVQTATAVRPAP